MSYTATLGISPDISTDALFRAVGVALNAKLAAMGLVQTADTGQINWTTVVKPTGTSVSMGYEIWRFADALQATFPIFIKVEYGSGVFGAGGFNQWFTIGTGSNGAGTLTGQVSTRRDMGGTPGTGAATKICVFSGDTNRLGMALFTDFGTCASAIFVERSKSSTGTDTNYGILITILSNAGGSKQQFMQVVPYGSGVLAATTGANILNMAPPTNAISGAIGSDLALYPHCHGIGGGYLNAGLSCIGYFMADIARDIPFTMTMYGATHTWYPLGNTSFLNDQFRGNLPTGGSVAMRYE